MHARSLLLLHRTLAKFPTARSTFRAYSWAPIDVHSPGGYLREEDEPDIPLMKRLNGFRDIRQHLKLYCQEWYNDIFIEKNRRELEPEHDQVRVEWSFKKNPEAIKRFLVTSDSEHKMGFSKGYLDLTKNNTLLFHGHLDTTVPKDGIVDRAGFAAMAIRRRKLKAFFRKDYFTEWRYFSHVLVKLRGDGRTYVLTLGCPGNINIEYCDVFAYPLHTHGGPYWQFAMVPFSKFILTVNGRIPDHAQRPLVQWKGMMEPFHTISTFGVTLMDRTTGPFQLEIEWIGVYKDVTNFEDWAYEMFRICAPTVLVGRVFMDHFASTSNLRERMEIEGLLSEAKALHDRVSVILSDPSPSAASVARPPLSHNRFPEHRMSPRPLDLGHRRALVSTQSWDDLFRRGRELDDRVQRLKFQVPSPIRLRQPEMDAGRMENLMASGEAENDENVQDNGNAPLDSRPLSASRSLISLRTVKDDELSKPTLRPIPRFEPGMPAFKNDPVRRYELYKHEWTKFPAPGEKKHLALRWKIREYMLRIDLPSDLKNATGRIPL